MLSVKKYKEMRILKLRADRAELIENSPLVKLLGSRGEPGLGYKKKFLDYILAFSLVFSKFLFFATWVATPILFGIFFPLELVVLWVILGILAGVVAGFIAMLTVGLFILGPLLSILLSFIAYPWYYVVIGEWNAKYEGKIKDLTALAADDIEEYARIFEKKAEEWKTTFTEGDLTEEIAEMLYRSIEDRQDSAIASRAIGRSITLSCTVKSDSVYLGKDEILSFDEKGIDHFDDYAQQYGLALAILAIYEKLFGKKVPECPVPYTVDLSIEDGEDNSVIAYINYSFNRT